LAIKKQEFYEGAALHLLVRNENPTNIEYDPPFFVLNGNVSVYLKYSTKGRSPSGFTFTTGEQALIRDRASKAKLMIGLICGADGVVAFTYEGYLSVAAPKRSAVYISCYRNHGEHYEVYGPDGKLNGKIAPSNWQKILE
jgi:hypothetical protein